MGLAYLSFKAFLNPDFSYDFALKEEVETCKIRKEAISLLRREENIKKRIKESMILKIRRCM